MKILLEQIKEELELPIVEDWRRTLGSAALATSLAIGGPNVSQANADNSHHRKHHHNMSSHFYNEQDIVRAIAGEAATYEGMLAVADVIRNRQRLPGEYRHNILKGVAGLHAKFLAHESPKRFELAKRAWLDSASKNIVGDAYLWGNDSDIQKWKNEPGFDFNKIEFLRNIEGNNFYRYRR